MNQKNSAPSLRGDMSRPRKLLAIVSPGELETCKCQDVHRVMIVPEEEFPRCLECLKPDRTLDVYEYLWVSFAYRLTLRRRGTKITSTEQFHPGARVQR